MIVLCQYMHRTTSSIVVTTSLACHYGLLPDRGVQGGEPDNLLQVPAEPGPGIQNSMAHPGILGCQVSFRPPFFH